MRRTSGNNAIRFESLEKALAESPETYGHIDLLCAGWPCQDNSIAGKRKGLGGEKSGLWKELARCLRIFRPKWFLGENVPGFLSVNNGKDFLAVLSELQEIGYGLSWRILDSQFFGVPQKRRRLYIVGRFGKPCPPEILFETKSNRNHSQIKTMGQVGVCVSTRDGSRQDPSTENIIAFCLRSSPHGTARKLHEETHIATTVRTSEPGNRLQGYVATTDTNGERTVTGFSNKLDSLRGILIGNAVSKPVAKWLGKRIMEFDKK